MSEDQAEYITESEYSQKSVIIERPRKVHGVSDGGLEEYNLSGWVKMSTKFCAHIKRLRGAKLAIWLCMALIIDEEGQCKLTQKELCELTGYSHTEVIDSVRELDEMGFLSVDRSGKKNLYQPVMVAKGAGNSPLVKPLVKKLDSTPADSLESSPLLEKRVPTSIKKEQDSNFNSKKQDIVDGIKKYDLAPATIRSAIKEHFRLNVNWDTKISRQWMEWAVGEKITPEQIKSAADIWRTDKLFNWQPPSLKAIFEKWAMLMDAYKPPVKHKSYNPAEDVHPEYVPAPEWMRRKAGLE